MEDAVSSDGRSKITAQKQSVQEVSERLNELLPTDLSGSDVEQNPEFVRLLTSLSHLLEPSGRSKESDDSVKQAECSLKQQKTRWLQYHTLYTELEEWLFDQQVAVTKSKHSENAKFCKAVQESLTFAETGDYLGCNTDPTLDVSLFGLSLEDIDRANPYHKHASSIQQSLIPEVESKLRKKCANLVQFHAQEIHADTDMFTFAKATRLPEILENEAQALESHKKQLAKDKANREKQFWVYYQSLVNSRKMLEQMIRKHRLKSQTQNNQINSEWLTARCDAMCLKVRVFEGRTLCDIYYAETVEALKKIRQHIAIAAKHTQEEILKSSQALKAYESVGMGFDSLAQEFAALLDQLENKKWALKELQQTSAKEL